MGTSLDFIEFVCECVRGLGAVRYRKMFGEYMVYIDEKPVLLVCDNTVYVKIYPELDCVLDGCETGFPYDGAKNHYILDIENRELTEKVIAIILPLTPIPKKKQKSAK